MRKHFLKFVFFSTCLTLSTSVFAVLHSPDIIRDDFCDGQKAGCGFFIRKEVQKGDITFDFFQADETQIGVPEKARIASIEKDPIMDENLVCHYKIIDTDTGITTVMPLPLDHIDGLCSLTEEDAQKIWGGATHVKLNKDFLWNVKRTGGHKSSTYKINYQVNKLKPDGEGGAKLSYYYWIGGEKITLKLHLSREDMEKLYNSES